MDVENGRISDIVNGIPDSVPDTKLIEFPEGSTLMPGFIDCHVHLTINSDDYQLDHLRKSSAEKSLIALRGTYASTYFHVVFFFSFG